MILLIFYRCQSEGFGDRHSGEVGDTSTDTYQVESVFDTEEQDGFLLEEGEVITASSVIPPKPRITINGIPDHMNGKIPFSEKGGEFRLRVPQGGFTVDIYNRSEKKWNEKIVLEASVPIKVNGSLLLPGINLAEILECGEYPDPNQWEDEKQLLLRCFIPEWGIEPTESCTFFAKFVNAEGIEGEMDKIVVEVVSMPSYLDPFPKIDVWLVVLSRDIFDHKLSAKPNGQYKIDTFYVPEGNGKPDLDEGLYLLGFLSENQNFSTKAKDMFLKKVRQYANQIFGLDENGQVKDRNSVRLSLFFEGDMGSPNISSYPKDFSMIAIGGDPNTNGLEEKLVGRAFIDPNNQKKDDNTGYGYGVFLTSIIRQVLEHPLGSSIVKEISPLDGTPFGMYPNDEQFLEGKEEFSDERTKLRHAIFSMIIDFLSLAVATTLCHEIGHSLGLVPNGPPPNGLFGGMDNLPFTVSNPGMWHIDTPGLNIMQTGKNTNFFEILVDKPRFNQLNMAYLRRRLVVGAIKGGVP